jgi:L-asparaginase
MGEPTKSRVNILTTGGTIEKSYCESDGSIKNQESQLKARLLSRLRLPYTDIWVEEVMAKDSLDMTTADRDLIFQRIATTLKDGSPIVVLHGTDTMAKTLDHCFQKMPNPPVAVVFTGAMTPAGFIESDAQQNFTEALYACQIIPPGFYISFHGALFKAPHVQKNHERLTFESTKP